MNHFLYYLQINKERWSKYIALRTLTMLLLDLFLASMAGLICLVRAEKSRVDCDVLIVAVPKTEYLFTSLKRNLSEQGYDVCYREIGVNGPIKHWFSTQFRRELYGVYGLRERMAVSNISHYKPQVVLSNYHMGIIPSLVRRIFQCKTIFLPHSVIDGTYRYSNFDYDYYGLFGFSSKVAVEAYQGKRIASPKFELIGDWRHDKSLFTTYLQSLGECIGYFTNPLINDQCIHQKTFELFLSSIESKDKIKIRVHPLLDRETVIDLVYKTIGSVPDNVEIIDAKEQSIETYLKDLFCVVHSYSNAALEAAYFGVPSLVLYPCPIQDINDIFIITDYLGLRKYFGNYAVSKESLRAEIDRLRVYGVDENVLTGFYSHNIASNGNQNLLNLIDRNVEKFNFI